MKPLGRRGVGSPRPVDMVARTPAAARRAPAVVARKAPAVLARKKPAATRSRRGGKPAANRSNPAVLARPAAAARRLGGAEQYEYTRMRKVLKMRTSRGGDQGAADILAEADALPSAKERLALLKEFVVGPAARVRCPQSRTALPRFRPSVGHSIDGISLEFLRAAVVVKGFRTKSLACRRTLAVYGEIRSRGLDHKAPLPFLYKTEEDGPTTKFYMEFMGPDASTEKIPVAEFCRLKKKSVADLRRCGVRIPTVSRHLKNWCVTAARGSTVRRAWLIDVGSTSAARSRAPGRRERS